MTSYSPIVLERGRTQSQEFEQWANQVWKLGQPGAEVEPKEFRKDVTIELLNEAGQLVLAFKLFRCWPSEYVALPDLDANGTAVAIESLALQNEGWERDASVAELGAVITACANSSASSTRVQQVWIPEKSARANFSFSRKPQVTESPIVKIR